MRVAPGSALPERAGPKLAHRHGGQCRDQFHPNSFTLASRGLLLQRRKLLIFLLGHFLEEPATLMGFGGSRVQIPPSR